MLMGVWEKGGEEIWFLFYWDSVIKSYLKANYVFRFNTVRHKIWSKIDIRSLFYIKLYVICI